MKFDIGVDIGTTNTRLHFKEDVNCISMPSVIAIKKNNNQIVGIGEKAYDMLGKTPSNIVVKKTIKSGVVRDIQLNKIMMRKILEKKYKNNFIKPKICICFHSFLTNLEMLVLKNSIFPSNSQKIYLIEESLASGIGAGFDFSNENAVLVVNIGGGTTDISVISSQGVLINKSLQIGTELMDKIIYKNLAKEHDFLIGMGTAEKIKKKAVTMLKPSSDLKFKLKGKDKITGMPKVLEISQEELSKKIDLPIRRVVEEVLGMIKELSVDVASDVQKNGILLTGGGSLTSGLKEFLQSKLQIKTTIAKNNLNCAASGALKAAKFLKEDYFSDYILPA